MTSYASGPIYEAGSPYGTTDFYPSPAKSARKKVNWIGIVISYAVPWAIFTALLADLSFGWRYDHVDVSYFIVVLGVLFVAYLGYSAYAAFKKWAAGDSQTNPNWLVFLFITSVIAAVAGIVLGDINYQTYSLPVKQLESLGFYPDVNPATVDAETYMDAGQVMFAEGSYIDATLSIGFKSETKYCVAPITHGTDQLTAYSFWAVGKDCCGGNGGDFHCGAYANPIALGGLREVDENDRAFYRLAVQSAAAAYHIDAPHPLFFRWTEDPRAALRSRTSDVDSSFYLGILIYLAVQAFFVTVAMLVFSKFGFQRR